MTDVYEKWAQDHSLSAVKLTKPANDEPAVIQVGTVAGKALYYLLQDEGFVNSTGYKPWVAAHCGMLAAVDIGDWDCAAQDTHDAIKLGPKELMPYYKAMMSRIISALSSGDASGGEIEKFW